MSKALRSSRTGGVLGTVGFAVTDAIGRLLLLSGATVLLSRLVTANDFGISAIILAITSAASLMVGAPFEDVLTQKKVLRRDLLRAAWGVGLLVSLAMIAASLMLGTILAKFYGQPEIAVMLPVTMASIVFVGHGDLATARARRLHRFSLLAAVGLISHLIAVPVAVFAAYQGAGAWSLILLRLVTVVVRSIWLQLSIGFPLIPRFSLRHLAEIRRYATLSMLDKLTDNLTYLMFNNVIALFFGLTALGYVNMAMRLVEPIRGAVLATLHNLSFAHFRRTVGREDLVDARDMLIRTLAYVFSAMFAGLAAVIPVLMPLATGPGWEVSVPIGAALAIGAAFLLPAQPVYTCLMATGRPEYSLFGNFAKLLVTTLALVSLRHSDPQSIGLARLAGDLCQTFFVLLVPLRGMDWPPSQRVMLLLPAWLTSGFMALTVSGALLVYAGAPDLAVVSLVVLMGIATQVFMMAFFSRSVLTAILDLFRRKSSTAGELAR